MGMARVRLDHQSRYVIFVYTEFLGIFCFAEGFLIAVVASTWE